MRYVVDLNDRPWKAIFAGTKKVEVRTNTTYDSVDYGMVKAGDEVMFINVKDQKQLLVRVVRVTHYQTVRELLEAEKTQRTLSSGRDITGGIESIHSITGYAKAISKFGVWALEVERAST